MPSDPTLRVAKATAAALAVAALAVGIWQVRSVLILLLCPSRSPLGSAPASSG